jgi:hypothetical protein
MVARGHLPNFSWRNCVSNDNRATSPEDSEPMVAVIVIDPMFPLGQLVSTPGALAALEVTGQSPLEFVARHCGKDWGELDAEDTAANNYAVEHDERVLSAYSLYDQTKIWIITEADRSSTCILLPSEY